MVDKETIEKRLREFTEYFIDEFETRIEFYRKVLEEKSDKKGDNSLISGSKQGVSASVSFASGIPFLGPVIGAIYEQGGKKIYNTYEDKSNKKEANSLYELIYSYKEDESFKKLIIETCYEIFYSFERQFLSVTTPIGGATRAMLKIAKTCVGKILNYFVNNETKFTPENIIQAVVVSEEGAFKKYVACLKVGRTVYQDETKINTMNLLTKCAVFDPKTSKTYSKNDIDPILGFRRVTTYENLEEIEKTHFQVEQKEIGNFVLTLEQKSDFVGKFFEEISKRDPKLMEARLKDVFTGIQTEILSQVDALNITNEVKSVLDQVEKDILNEICLYYVKSKTLFDAAAADRHFKHDKTIAVLGVTNNSLATIDVNLKETLQKVTFIHEKVKVQEEKGVIFNIQTPTVTFVGRDDQLNELDDVTMHNNIIVVYGQRGVGKTETLKKFVQTKKILPNLNIIWINCNTNETLIQNFKDLALVLGFKMPGKTNLTLIEETFQYFSEKQTIFIFDHCKSTTLFLNNLKDLFKIGSENRIILVSSSARNWNDSYHVITLPRWPPTAAFEYVKTVLTTELPPELNFSDSDYQKLVDFHDCLPFSLSHATSFIVQLNNLYKKPFTIDDYIKKYSEAEIEPINEPPQEDGDSSDEEVHEKVFRKIDAEAVRFERRVTNEAKRIGNQIGAEANRFGDKMAKIFGW